MLAVDEEHESDGARAARRSAYAIAARHRLRRANPVAAGKPVRAYHFCR